jgi:hypothetical protein
MLTPDQQPEMIKQMAARKAAQDQLIAIETGAVKR